MQQINLFETEEIRKQCTVEIKEAVASLEGNPSVHPWQLEGLAYGVAVHHAGCNDSYLKEVERLFRARYLRVVIATSTLALGVHMPCRSVVMAGKSIYTTTIMFNQCSGRAGRRGFDDKGRVIFWNYPKPAIDRLMTAENPSIIGSLGLSPTFVLRLMAYFSNSPKQEKELEVCIKTLNQPMFCLGKPLHQLPLPQIKHHIRFTLEFLRRMHMLSSDGRAINLAGIASHLFYTEPHNFLFAYLLQEGIFHKYIRNCRKKKISSVIILENIVSIIACHFCRVREWKEANVPRLLPIPEDFKGAIYQFHDSVRSIYANYVRNFCKTHPADTRDDSLCFSPKFPIAEELKEGDCEKSFISQLWQSRKIHYGVSVFAALSGNGDNFENVEQILATMKHTIALDGSILPEAEMEPEGLNGFILQFYKHGSLKRIMEDCKLNNTNEVAQKLRRFHKDVRKIKTQLELLIEEEDRDKDDVWWAVDEICEKFWGYLEPKRVRRPWKPYLRDRESQEDKLLRQYGKTPLKNDEWSGKNLRSGKEED